MRSKMKTLILLAGLLSMAAPASLLAQDQIQARELVARPNIQVSSVLITLGDLFENAGSKSEIAVFRAPAPGKTGYIRAERLKAAARKHGLEWTNPDGLPRINIARQSKVISPAEITASIRRKLVETVLPSDDEISLKLRFSKPPAPLHLPLRSASEVNIDNVNYDADSGRFTAMVNAVLEDGQPARRIYYSGRAIRTLQVPVLIHPVDRGSIIGIDDLGTKGIPLRSLNRAPLRRAADVIGMAAKRNLRVGVALFKRDIEPPQIVNRNALVRIIFKTPGLALTTKGKALASGAMGDVIDILNVRSKRIIQARIIARDTVSPLVATDEIGRTASLKRGKVRGR